MALLAAPAFAGPTNNIIVHANVDDYAEYNDIWGYTAPNGDEYALLGTTTGLSVVNIVDPAHPYETGFIPGPTSLWRDIKTYSHYAYVVQDEGSGGMRIVDLDDPEDPQLVATYTAGGHNRAHNLYIDVPTARAYICGNNGTGGFIMLDLTSPTAPTEVTRWDVAYLHDIMVQNGVAYGSAINVDRLYVLDVSNPASITTLGTAEGYPAAFTHNAWVTADDAYVMTTDETSSSSTRMWDLSTLPNLAQTDSYRPSTTTIPHNAHIDGDLAIISYYTLGVKIVDISDPFDIVEVAAFDSYPANDGGTYDGCWGAYPFFQTNPDLIVIADINTGLYILEYKGPLGTLAGDVTESGSGTPIANATVRIVQSDVEATTNGSGAYTIQDVAGSVDVEVSAYGYVTDVVPASIVTGVITPLDVELDLLPSGSVAGTVTAAVGGAMIPGVLIELLSTPLEDTTDGAGDYGFAAVPVGSYTLRATAFGYRPLETVVSVGAGGSVDLDLQLNAALHANTFEIGFAGWSVSGTATTGTWEVANPQGTFSGGTPVQPEDDHTPTGTLCWVTGATSGGSIGGNDVDNGTTILTSPSFVLGSSTDPYISYWKWYSTGIGNANLDDWVVQLSTDGGGTWPVELENTDQSTNAWVLEEFRILDYITPTNLTRIRFIAQDQGDGGIVEAAIDDFMIYDGVDQGATGVPVIGPGSADRILLSRTRPNPIRPGDIASVDLALPRDAKVEGILVDVAGRRVATVASGLFTAGVHRLEWDGRASDGRSAPAGVYFLRVEADGEMLSRKVLLIR
jgi:choice-of-anchor B domain-containing protein